MDVGRRYSPTADAPLSTYRALLEDHGLGGGVLVQPSFLGTDNSYLLSALVEARAWREGPQIWGVVVVPPETPRGVLDSMKSAGVVGVRLNLVGRPAPEFSASVWTRFFGRVNSLGWHVAVHVEGNRLADILRVLLDRCERVVVDHFGLPDAGAPRSCPGFRALLAAPPGRLWIKTTAPSRIFKDLSNEAAAARCGELFQALAECLGTDALLWGSDWPWTQHASGQSFADTLDWLDAWRGHRRGEGRAGTESSSNLGEIGAGQPGTGAAH